jgi:hypoxanthine phosphoribosyltransferase
VEELGAQIAQDYAGRDLVLVTVLKGAFMFLADLSRAVPINHALDFMVLAGYDGALGGRTRIRVLKDLDLPVAGREVLVVENVIDTGLTLNYLRTTLTQRGARSLMAITLLDKVARRIVPVALEQKGFEIPDVFVVGYGLDFQGRYRNLRDIYAVRDIARLANDPNLLVDGLFAPHEEAEGRPPSPVGRG